MIGKKTKDNQTQFAEQLPVISPEQELPIDDEEAAAAASLAQAKRRKKMTMVGLGLVAVAIVLFWLASRPPQSPLAPTISISPTPSISPEFELSLRQKIDRLQQSVENFNRPSQQLVFPPVEPKIRVDEAK